MSVPPPPPPPQATTSGSSVGDDRNLLLQSIRTGKTLRKTVTVDKSIPVVTGRVKGEPTSPSLSTNFRNNNSNVVGSSNSSNGGPVPLGGLFAGGMPRLKPTGLRGNMTEKEGQSVNNSSFLHSSPGSSSHSIKRGPPPIPPPAAQKPQIYNQGQSTTDSTGSNLDTMSRGFAKSAIVPKPVPQPSLQKPSPPPKKLNLSSASVARAQSMRLPRSSPILVPTPSFLHQSQDCLNETMTMPQPARTTNRVLRPPVTRPPSPPTSRTANARPPSPPTSRTSSAFATRVPSPPASRMTGFIAPMTVMRAAPPPPSRVTVSAPCIPPPPPPLPHRPALTHQRLAPPPPPPPTPPTRSLSVRNGSQAMASSVDLEVRFAEMFHPVPSFPPPEPFRGFVKVYSSRNAAKQQAPAPPLQPASTPNTLHSLNTSSGNKQWQHNATSLAY